MVTHLLFITIDNIGRGYYRDTIWTLFINFIFEFKKIFVCGL